MPASTQSLFDRHSKGDDGRELPNARFDASRLKG